LSLNKRKEKEDAEAIAKKTTIISKPKEESSHRNYGQRGP
jgi:hypothetical protein